MNLGISALVLILGGVQATNNVPIVTAEGAFEMLAKSARLSKELSLFVVGRLHQNLPEDFQVHLARYSGMFQERWNPLYAQVVSLVEPVFGAVSEWTTTLAHDWYSTINKQSGRVLDSVISEFENFAPSAAGLVGSSVADRVLLFFWLLLLVKVIWAIATAPFRRKPASVVRSAVLQSAKKAGQESPQSTTPEKKVQNPQPRTVKKKIVISK